MGRSGDSPSRVNDLVVSLLARILIRLMKEMPQREKILELNRVGFTNLEISDHIETKPQVVAQTIYEHKKARGRRGASR